MIVTLKYPDLFSEAGTQSVLRKRCSENIQENTHAEV